MSDTDANSNSLRDYDKHKFQANTLEETDFIMNATSIWTLNRNRDLSFQC